MSDHWISLIPESPRFVPDTSMCKRARNRFAVIAPNADEILIKVFERIEFFHCGSNFERIVCPSCAKEIPVDWWQERMAEDSQVEGSQNRMYENKGSDFRLATYTTPCCGNNWTLHELVYEWPQGFGRFAIEAMNPDIGVLNEKYQREFENILGTKLRVIYLHI